MNVPPYVRTIAQGCAEDLTWVEQQLRAAREVEWVSDAAALYALRLADASRAVGRVQARASAAERAVARLAAS